MRFSYIRYDETSAAIQQLLKEKFEEIEAALNVLSDGRAKSLCLTSLEEAYMWTGKAIRDDQIARERAVSMGVPPECVERGAQ